MSHIVHSTLLYATSRMRATQLVAWLPGTCTLLYVACRLSHRAREERTILTDNPNVTPIEDVFPKAAERMKQQQRDADSVTVSPVAAHVTQHATRSVNM